ncbi:MAG: P1 family peptidase, partial [Acidobacteria bacterium]|nr:P1 family peptidase [Acidobacteriota bacterium]
IEGEGTLVIGKGPVRTGLTAVFPQRRSFSGRVFGAWFTLNGNGEMTGTTWLRESGCLGTPILITNTHRVGVVRDAVIEWNSKRGLTGDYSGDFSLPVVAETWDGFLNDIDGFHIKKIQPPGAIVQPPRARRPWRQGTEARSGLQVHLPQQGLKGRARSQAIVGRASFECCHKDRITLLDTRCDPLQALVRFSQTKMDKCKSGRGHIGQPPSRRQLLQQLPRLGGPAGPTVD